jgi:hypothetical protein
MVEIHKMYDTDLVDEFDRLSNIIKNMVEDRRENIRQELYDLYEQEEREGTSFTHLADQVMKEAELQSISDMPDIRYQHMKLSKLIQEVVSYTKILEAFMSTGERSRYQWVLKSTEDTTVAKTFSYQYKNYLLEILL